MKFNFKIFLISIVLSSCISKQETLEVSKENQLNKVFGELFLKWKEQPIVHTDVLESKKPSQFCIHQKTLYKNFLNLKYSLYSINNSCSACWEFNVIHIFNDSISFALPFWDDFYYWKNAQSSKNRPQSDYFQHLSFEKRLKELIIIVSKNQYKPMVVREIITSIMDLNQISVFNKSDICGMENYNKLISSDSLFTTDECKTALQKNISELITITENSNYNTLIFQGDMMTYIFQLTNNEDLFNLKVLNHECMLQTLM